MAFTLRTPHTEGYGSNCPADPLPHKTPADIYTLIARCVGRAMAISGCWAGRAGCALTESTAQDSDLGHCAG